MDSASVFVIVVAAGSGVRLAGSESTLPKAYRPVAGVPLLQRTLECLVGLGVQPARVQTVIHPDHQPLYGGLTLPPGLRPACFGGASRSDSVRAGLEALALPGEAPVLVHDAARPFVSVSLLTRLLDALDHGEAVIPLLSLTDALKSRVDCASLPREDYGLAQTPQAFRAGVLGDAFGQADIEASQCVDEAALLSAAGCAVEWVEGCAENFKITHPADLTRAEALLGEVTYGSGFDLHRYGEDSADGQIVVGGVGIPHRQTLIGHSDGDVVLHALVDAILGTIAGGDIGVHFPPDDPRWKGQDSILFVREALARLRRAGGRLRHLDVTIVADAPKIGPHRGRIVARLAGITGLASGEIGLKATTTEGLGFVEIGDGIAAQVMVSIWRPKT